MTLLMAGVGAILAAAAVILGIRSAVEDSKVLGYAIVGGICVCIIGFNCLIVAG